MMLGPEQRWDEFLGESRFMEGAVGWGREIALCQHLESAGFDCCPNKVACQRLRRVWISV